MFLGSEDTGTYPVGWAGFRMLVDVKDIQRDPEIAWIVSKPRLHIWIGPGRSVMTYTVLGVSMSMGACCLSSFLRLHPVC